MHKKSSSTLFSIPMHPSALRLYQLHTYMYTSTVHASYIQYRYSYWLAWHLLPLSRLLVSTLALHRVSTLSMKEGSRVVGDSISLPDCGQLPGQLMLFVPTTTLRETWLIHCIKCLLERAVVRKGCLDSQCSSSGFIQQGISPLASISIASHSDN